jgi:hypothetical protein
MISLIKFRILFWFLVPVSMVVGGAASFASAANNCDKALSIFWKGKYASEKELAYFYYKKAIQLCPGFIRPYELLGNLYRRDGRNALAIEYFLKAAELGTTNYKLYYLLAALLFEQGDLDEADKNINKSIRIRADYPQALELKAQIAKKLDQEGPKIILFEPAPRRGIKALYRSESVSVRGIATDKSGVSLVRINQLDAPLDEHGNFLKDISIQIGLNDIVIEAADTLGNFSKLSVTVERKEFNLPELSKFDSSLQFKNFYEKSFAVVIGINDYDNWPVLEFAVNDASAVAQMLAKTGFNDITTIFDKEATQRRILSELFHTLPQKVGPDDRVLFYFAGHGQTEEMDNGGKIGYIIPVDAGTADYAATAVSMEQIRSLSSRIPAKHILYVMDSCYSGLGLSRSSGISTQLSGYLSKVMSMRVVQIITAGGKGEQVQERQGHGLFTTYLLRALEGQADINKDGVVTGTELGAYLRPQVSDASQNAQTPLIGRLEGEGEFLLFVERK